MVVYHQAELPSWAEACKLVLLVQPSSAAAERVSLLENSFSHQKRHSLKVCISLSVMLQYNYCYVFRKRLSKNFTFLLRIMGKVSENNG